MALHGCNLHGTGGILHGHERTCKICSIFMPRLDIDPSQVLSRSHGKSWQDLENFFLRECTCTYTQDTHKYSINTSTQHMHTRMHKPLLALSSIDSSSLLFSVQLVVQLTALLVQTSAFSNTNQARTGKALIRKTTRSPNLIQQDSGLILCHCHRAIGCKCHIRCHRKFCR